MNHTRIHRYNKKQLGNKTNRTITRRCRSRTRPTLTDNPAASERANRGGSCHRDGIGYSYIGSSRTIVESDFTLSLFYITSSLVRPFVRFLSASRQVSNFALRHPDDVRGARHVVGPPADGQHVISFLLAEICNVVDVRLLLLVRQLFNRVARW
jgi:hypothetical protein